jgi:hypothetical protein
MFRHSPTNARRPALATSLLCLTVCFSGHLFAQASSPDVARGVTTKALGDIELNKEIDDVSSRQPGRRPVTIEPGGRVTVHSPLGGRPLNTPFREPWSRSAMASRLFVARAT